MKLLDAVTGVGAGNGRMTDKVFAHHGWQISVTGAPSAVSVTLEGSLDGSTWVVLDTSTITTSEIRFVANKPVLFVRGNLGTLTGGTAPTVSVEYMGANA